MFKYLRKTKEGRVVNYTDANGNHLIYVNDDNTVSCINPERIALFNDLPSHYDYERKYDIVRQNLNFAFSTYLVNHNEKRKQQASRSSNNWYNDLDKDDLYRVLNRVHVSAAEIVREYIALNPTSALVQKGYYRGLLNRIEAGAPYIVLAASEKKMQMFPRYDRATDKLMGSAQRFVRLITHMYPPVSTQAKNSIII